MKNFDWLRRCAATLPTRARFKGKISGLLMLALLSFSACEERECSEDPGPAGNCSTFVTVEENNCWKSSVGNLWFRTDDGRLLMPSQSLIKLPELQAGMRLQIGYETIELKPQNALTCNFFAPTEMPAEAIKITCAEPILICGTPTWQCDTYATAETVVCGAGVWANIWLRLDDGTLLQPWESNIQGLQLVNGQRYKLGYELMTRDNRFNNAVICQAVPPVAQAARIHCLELYSQPN